MKNILKIFMLLSLVFTCNHSFSQNTLVSINIGVIPPYTPYISDYMDNPNKVIITLYLQSTTVEEMDVYLHGRITGESGINIFTDPNYKPGFAITLQNGIPYTLSADDMSNMYGMNNVIFEGISQQQVINQGTIPEDYYQICVEALNFETDVLVSDINMSCSPLFFITNMEAPIITSPVCGHEIRTQAQIPQSVYINWTLPMGANPSFISYFFRMVEVPENSGIDPIDVLNDNTYASIYEEELFSNSLLFTSDKVQLLPGNTYAFFVQAIAMDEYYYFNNNGVSEACWFTYAEESEIIFIDSSNSITDLSDFIEQFELMPRTKLSGRLLYKIPEGGASSMSLENFNPGSHTQSLPNSQAYHYSDINQSAIGYNGDANENHIGFFNPQGIVQTPGLHLVPPYGRGLLHANTESMEGSKSLANTEVRLVVRLGVFDHGPSFPTFMIQPPGMISGRGETRDGIVAPVLVDIDGNLITDGIAHINAILDVDVTDENGHFSFDFFDHFISAPCQVNDITGHTDIIDDGIQVDDIIGNTINPIINPMDLLFQGLNDPSLNTTAPSQVMSGVYYSSQSTLAYICLKVEVVNQKFCSPDVDIFAMPGDQIDLGNQVAKLKTYHAAITINSNEDIPQKNGPNKGMRGADVKILRNIQDLDNEHPIVLLEEGQKLSSRTINNNGEFDNISIEEADAQGFLSIKNLIKRWPRTDGDGPYQIDIATRVDHPDSAYDNTEYNYINRFEFLPRNPENTAQYYTNIPIICNNAYQVPTIPFTFKMKPRNPEIKGRVMAMTQVETIGMANTQVILFTQEEYRGYTHSEITGLLGGWAFTDLDWNSLMSSSNIPFTLEKDSISNGAGFFRFKNLEVATTDNNNPKGPYRRLMVIKEGYRTKIIPPFEEPPLNLNNGQLMDFREIFLEPKELLYGTVENETGEPIKAYVRLLDDGPYEVTKPRFLPLGSGPKPQDFQLAVEATGNRIEVVPLSSQYFSKEYEVNDIPNDRLTFTVFKKLHRLHLVVLNELQEEIANAHIVIGDSLAFGTTNAYGVFRATFASPDEQFVMKINAENYAPHQEILMLPATEHTNTRNVSLQHSFSIYGYISDAQNHEKIAQAKVFTELQNTGGHHLYLETETDSSGYYSLEGIPWDTRQLELHIVKGGNDPSYIGKIVEIGVSPHHEEYYNFEIYHLDDWDLTAILGFPLQVEGFIGQENPDRAIIEGYLYQLPTTYGYQAFESNLKLPFTSLLVEKQADGKIIPITNTIILEEVRVPVKVNNTFSGVLQEPRCHFLSPFKKLKVEKVNNQQGLIQSALKLDLESFRFAYHFDGDFYIGDRRDSYTSTVFKSNMGNAMQSTERFVFDINCNNDPMPIKGYSVFGFTADADRNHSTILGDQIMLKTILNTNIPIGYSDSLNLRLPIGSVQIKQEEINIIKSLQNELIFQLEKWEVIAKEEWSFDINEESIILPEVLINSTQGFSATVTDLRIRPDALREGNVSVDGGLNLGGIAPLILTDGLEPIFNYDAGIGHYRISLVGETGLNNAAYVEYLPNTQTKLEFSSVGLLSNDESALVVDKNMRFFDIIDIDINMITSGNGYFSLSGRPTLDFIPGLIPDGATMTFTKENNQLKSRLERLQGSIECYHNVEFVLDQQNPDLDPLNPDIQNIKDGEYTIYGDFIVSPSSNEGAGDPFKLRGLLTKTNDHINIDVINVDNQSHPIRSGSLVQHLKLGNKKLNVFEGNINVINQAWDSLRFKAHPNANDMVGLSEDNVLEFTVNGNVSANSKEIKVSEIDTPFGEAKFAFDFTEPSLSGSIRIEVPVSVGFATLNQGMIKMRFDPKGFYILADANMLIAPSPVPVRGGLVIGNTSRNLNSELYPLLAGFRTNKPNFSSGLEGFYAIGQRSLNLGHFNVGIITAALDMGAGTYLFCNFAENFKFTVGGYGYLEAHGGISDPCEIGLYMDANANMEGGYDNGWWYSSCNKIGARISLCIGSETFLVHGKMSNRGSSWGHGNCPANK